MNEIIGLIVLTSPLFIILLWLPVSFTFAFFVTRILFKQYYIIAKVLIGISISIFTILIPFGDEIAGTIYFKHICYEMAGAKVYKPIKLATSFWGKDGAPLFYDGNSLPSKEYESAGISVEAIETNHLFNIEEFGTCFRNKKTNEVVSEVIGFRYWGGYIKRNFSPHNTAISCGGGKSYDELVRKQFVPAENTDITYDNEQITSHSTGPAKSASQ